MTVRFTLTQNCGSSAWDFVYFTVLATAVWRWFLDFCKICEYLLMSIN